MSALILGSIEVTDAAVVTNKDTYLLSNITAVSVRRPLLAPGCLFGGGFALFAVSFGDLLYAHEFAVVMLLVTACLTGGIKLARLQLLSRDLKNTELADAIWGEVSALQEKRTQIAFKIASKMNSHTYMEMMQ